MHIAKSTMRSCCNSPKIERELSLKSNLSNHPFLEEITTSQIFLPKKYERLSKIDKYCKSGQ